MPKTICIVGTDTEIGKTYASCQILRHCAGQNRKVAALKPIASGLSHTAQGFMNEDVFLLHEACSEPLAFEQINAFSFKAAIAPHIAATLEQVELDVKHVLLATAPMIDQYDLLLIEGVGGIMTPLNATETYVDLLTAWQCPIILVVGMKLGCLNHALLTAAGLAHLNLVGWIANCLEPNMPALAENLAYLESKLTVPLLAKIPYQGSIHVTKHFNSVIL